MKRKTRCLMTVLLAGIMATQTLSALAGERMGDRWNEVNVAYRSGNYQWQEELVEIDESHIVDEVIPAKLIVQEDVVLRKEVNNHNLGVCYEIPYMSADNFLEYNTLALADGYKEMAERIYNFPVVRFGGGSTDNFSLKFGERATRYREPEHDKISQYMATRKPGAFGGYDRDNAVAHVEFIKLTQAINPNVKYIITIPWQIYTTEDRLAFVGFFVDEADESEYGALRASCGIEEPIDVLCFELGNEVYCSELGHASYNNPRTAAVYVEDMLDFLEKAKVMYPEEKWGVCLRANYQTEPETWNSWNQWMAEAVGHLVDFAIPHMYYSGYEEADWFWQFDEQYKAFEDVLGEDCDIKFLVTEHAKWSAKNHGLGQNDRKEFSTHALSGVLAVAQYYNACYSRDFIDSSTYYCYKNSAWSVVEKIDQDWIIGGIPQMWEVYESGLGDRSVKSWLESDTVYTDKSSTALEFTNITFASGDNELTVYLTNRLPYTEFDLDLTFNDEYTLVEETVWTAPNIYSFAATKDTEDIFETTVTEHNEENFSHYRMPAKSLVILRLKKQS